MDSSSCGFVQEIIKDCRGRNINVSVEFLSFLVSIVSLSLTYQSNAHEDTRTNERRIHTAVIEKLLDQSGPSLRTLKSQFYFGKHYMDRDSIIKKHRAHLTGKTAPLVIEICEIEQVNNTKEIEVLYQKMLVVITIISGLGNPILPAVLREVAIGLQSVLQPSELPRFVALSPWDKEEQLLELVHIVAGIRLFNRDCGRGGQDIDDLPGILQVSVMRTHSSIIQFLELLMQKIYKLSAATEAVIYNHDTAEGYIDFKDILWLVETLLGSRQLEIYVRKLLSDLLASKEAISGLICRFRNGLNRLHETVKYRTAIPTSQVYPQFKDLTDIWLRFQNEIIALSYINDMLWQLQCFYPKISDTHHHVLLSQLLKKVKILSDAERMANSMGKLIVDCGDCHLAYPSPSQKINIMDLQLFGFCIWSFVSGFGALIPGNPNIGVVEWKGKGYAFSSIEAAQQFGLDPDRYIDTALNIIKTCQEFIHFFQLHKEIQIMNCETRLASGDCLPFKIIQHQGVQTETHIVPTFIDKNYSSSLWQHRQRALQLANICQRVTHSTQTVKSHFRTGICLQTLQPKEKEVQTRRETGINTKKLNKYIFGLKNKDGDVQFIDYSVDK